MSSWSQQQRRRFWVEIFLAAVVGVAALMIAAGVRTAVRSHIPAVLLGLFFFLAVLVVATEGSRRAALSEQAQDVLVGEQAALRRVATLVVRGHRDREHRGSHGA